MERMAHEAYLDDLRGLAFDLMGYGGGLVHLGNSAKTAPVIQVRQESRGEKQARREPPVQPHSVG